MPYAYKNITADGAIKSGPGILYSVVLTPAAAKSTLILYDNTAASGSIICQLQAAADGSSATAVFPGGVSFGKGCYADIGGAAAAAAVSYE